MRRKVLLFVIGVVPALLLISISFTIFRRDPDFPLKRPSNTHVLGSEDARVSIIGYFDLEAPESREAWEKISHLREQYGDRLSIEFRHYPITAIHRHAMSAAQALEAAGEQGKFWEFLDMLWEQRDAWRSVSDPAPLFTQYAEQSSVPDIARFQEDVDRQRFSDRILLQLQRADDVGVSLERPFSIDDQLVSVSGAQLAVERILSKPERQD